MITVEDRMYPAPSTGMSGSATSGGPSAHVACPPPRLYPVAKPFVTIPGRRSQTPCHALNGAYLCTRTAGHRGRHAQVNWGMGGRVRAVWGVKDTAGAPE